ncbi:MAG: O-antigen ligase family protein [Poseidonibacter sp.]|uniref:O-antigen ligase family protein n=1 Tax=Poseidonibacter sp. TaxID=2321188 RepID=UPI00359D2F8F
MSKYYRADYLFNILLLIWCMSIPFKNAVYQSSTALIIIFFLIYLIKNKDYKYFKELSFKFKDLVLGFSLIILSMTVSNFINDVSKTDAWRIELMFILRYAFIFIILLYFYSKHFFNKKTLFIFVFSSLFIQSFDGVYQSILGYDFFKHNIGDLNRGLTAATFNRNSFGLFMGIALIISLIYLSKITKVNIKLFFFFLSMLMFAYTTLFSYSRAVWVALFLSLLISLIINFKSLKFKHMIFCISVTFTIILIFQNIDSLSNRFDTLLAGNSSHRDIIWLKAIELIQLKPFFGFGLDTWQIYGLKQFAGLHNSILEILLFTGLFGLLAFFIMLFLVLKTIYIKKEWDLLLILNYLFVVSQFDQSIFKGKTFLCVITIFMFYVYVYRIDNKKIKD